MRGLSGVTLASTLAWRNLLRNPRRSVLTLLAITLGVWSSISLSAFARGVSDQLARDAIYLLTGHVQIHAPGYVNDPSVDYLMPGGDERLARISSLPGVTGWAARVRVPAVVMSERDSLGVTAVGIDPDRERGVSFAGALELEGSPLGSVDDEGILLGKKAAEVLRTEIGKRVVLMGQDAQGKIAERGFIVKGLFDEALESTEKAFVFIGMQAAQDLFALSGAISELSLVTTDRAQAQTLASKVRAVLPNYEVHAWQDLSPFVVAILKMQNGVLNFWFLIVVSMVAFGLVNTLFMAIFERLREIGLVQALGMKPSLIVTQIVVESIVLLVTGIVIGNLLVQATLYLLRDGVDISQFSRGAEMMGLRSVVHPVLLMRDFVNANLMVVIVGVVSSLYPAWRASRYNSVEALRSI